MDGIGICGYYGRIIGTPRAYYDDDNDYRIRGVGDRMILTYHANSAEECMRAVSLSSSHH